MNAPAEWQLSFGWVPETEERVLEASFVGVTITTVAEVAVWERCVREELGRFGRQLVLLIDLDELHVKPRAASAFGLARSRVLADFTRRSFRYGGDGWTRTSINTSYALHGADSNLYPSRAEALAAIADFLANEGGPTDA